MTKKLKTNFNRWELLTAICKMANEVHKRIHPYGRKKFKPHTITIGDIFTLGVLTKKSLITDEDIIILHENNYYGLKGGWNGVLSVKVDKVFPIWNIEDWFLKLGAINYIK